MKILKKFHFQDSNVDDSEFIQLCKTLVVDVNYYARHRNDVGKNSTPFRNRLKADAKLHTQRPTFVPIQCRGKQNAPLIDQPKNGIIKQVGSGPHEKPNFGSIFLKPLIIIKNDPLRSVLHARHLNSNFEQSFVSCPPEPLAKKTCYG